MAAPPPYVRTWKTLLTAGTPGKRIPYVSLADTMQNYLFNWKNFLVTTSGAATKYSVLWSAAGGVGPANAADHTDRWANAAAVTPRAAIAAASQAWMILTDGNAYPAWQAAHVYALGDRVTNNTRVYQCIAAGASAGAGGPTTQLADIADNVAHWIYLSEGTGAAQILLAWQGASDDICRASYSPGGLFVLAGATTNQPTATDEQLFLSTVTVIGAAASSDRVMHMWATDDAKGFRVALYRLGVIIGVVWGVEAVDDSSVQAPAYIPCRVWGFAWRDTTMGLANIYANYIANVIGGLLRSWVSSAAYDCQCAPSSGEGTIAGTYTYQPELQGGGFVPWAVPLHTSNAAGARGRIGTLIDWWVCTPAGFASGDGFGASYQWHQIGAVMWPNPTLVAPTTT